MEKSTCRQPRTPYIWMGLLLLTSCMLVLPSAALWFESPMRLIQHEFDLFLGVFDNTWLAHYIDLRFWGKWTHFIGFSFTGFFFFKLICATKKHLETVSLRPIILFSSLMSIIYALGTPWVSPDVFFYIGTGWLDGHYHLSPYLYSISEIHGFNLDEMFQNIFSKFLKGSSSYGPIFQAAMARITLLSFGNEKIALALFKCLNLVAYAACAILVYQLSSVRSRKLSLLLYAANPLILFSMLTCAHNDTWMILFILLGIFALTRKHFFMAGLYLGLAISIKYVPLFFIPFIMVNISLEKDNPNTSLRFRFIPALMFLIGLIFTCAIAFTIYPEALTSFIRITKTNGVSVYRNSIYHLLTLLQYFGLTVPPLSSPWPICAFILGYAGLWCTYVVKTIKGNRPNLIATCLLALTIYFFIAMQSIQEWYIVWLLTLSFILDENFYSEFGLILSCFFMPLVIFTVNPNASTELIANSAIYIIVALSIFVLWLNVFWSRHSQTTLIEQH